MRKLLGISLITVVAFVAGRLSQLPPVSAQEKPPPTCGDLNGDGNLNLSDPVYLLNHLFRGGQEPVCPQSSALLATGQTKCYDVEGNEIPCDSETCPGQDGFYQTGCPMEGRIVDNGDGTVTDNCTGLMWQRDTGNDGAQLTWCNALAYCEDLELAGHDDWRLPNVRELQSIVDYGRLIPSIDPVFGGALLSFYWSSTSRVGPSPGSAWGVGFGVGIVDAGFKSGGNIVRAVRSGP